MIHLTGMPQVCWKIKRIEAPSDPCPMKLSQKEINSVLATSKAQSIVSSRNSSRKSSRKGSMDENIEVKRDPITGIECIQAGNEKEDDENKRDNATIENNPGMFAAE